MERDATPMDLAEYLASRWPNEPALAAASSRGASAKTRGAGAVLGLLDAAIELDVEDLVGAALQVRGFARRAATAQAARDHGTCSATLLVGQGAQKLRGLLPGARLHVATVAEADGGANPTLAAEALAWLVDSGATLIAVPMGSREREPELERAVAYAAARGVPVLAARGGPAGEPAWFPAGYPTVRAVAELSDGEIPVVGSDGTLSLRGGSSIACVVAAALAVLGSR
ncbi:MAG: hypothetical protein IPI49_14950 [Myxococcales bacterium]|nr:hypothetical protein [Myxococcales bacterium]